ncbi:hypothetical protein L1049_015511 [Liquidambar formosana]|uniref:PGG domain-containing protein n=1 Tax=Liquidambar formosana TaxID=63359 RepID=A0AAP0RXP2_LIQFO
MELNHEVDIHRYRSLYQAALNGDWECASRFIERDGCAWSVKASMQSMTALHVAIAAGCFQFVKKLVEKVCVDELAIKDSIGCTAVHYAAAAGSTKLDKAMVKKNPVLTQITNEVEITPLFTAAAWGRKEVLWYLSSVTRDELPSSPGPSACLLFNMVVTAGFQDIALNLLQQYPNLPTVVCDNDELTEVEKIIFPLYKHAQNNNKKIAWEVFMEEHKELVESGEKWMKVTSNSCMLVATLIATVVFAAAFTVPGGNANNNGVPIFLNRNFFILFAISDALALFSSYTSLLIFLSILTSRYAEEDFLESLPKRLINGLASLFFAIVTMMIAFTATLSIVLGEKWKWACIPIAIGACFPMNLFAIHQLPLFVQIIQSTYGFGIFHQQSNLTL